MVRQSQRETKCYNKTQIAYSYQELHDWHQWCYETVWRQYEEMQSVHTCNIGEVNVVTQAEHTQHKSAVFQCTRAVATRTLKYAGHVHPSPTRELHPWLTCFVHDKNKSSLLGLAAEQVADQAGPLYTILRDDYCATHIM